MASNVLTIELLYIYEYYNPRKNKETSYALRSLENTKIMHLHVIRQLSIRIKLPCLVPKKFL